MKAFRSVLKFNLFIAVLLGTLLFVFMSCDNPFSSEDDGNDDLKYTIDNKYKYDLLVRIWDENNDDASYRKHIAPYGEKSFKFKKRNNNHINFVIESGSDIYLKDEVVNDAEPGEYWIYIINYQEIWAEYQG